MLEVQALPRKARTSGTRSGNKDSEGLEDSKVLRPSETLLKTKGQALRL